MLKWSLKVCHEHLKMGIFALITGRPGPSGFGSATTAEQLTRGMDASNLTIIVTGGAGGLGLETSRVLAIRGAHVIIAARNMEAANRAKLGILEECKTAKVDILELDLCSINSIRSFVDQFNALNVPLNILINNAGIHSGTFRLTENGIEVHFGTNHIGHFLLTELLLGKMKLTARITGIEGRIVNLSSIAHVVTYKGGINFDKINSQSCYSKTLAYGQSKLANILHANELSRLLKEEGALVTANSVHPGCVMTKIFNDSKSCAKALKLISSVVWKNVAQGAATTCYVALHPNLKGVSGRYYADCNEFKPSALARDVELGKKLWDFSNKMIDSASPI